MPATGDHGPAALIIGELCLDVHAVVPGQRDSTAPALADGEISALGDITMLPGGTAWLFAEALASSCDVQPLIVAAIARDWAGDFLVTSLADRAFPRGGLLQTPSGRTDVVTMTSFDGSGRLMVRPAVKLSHRFRAWDRGLVVDLVASREVRFAWVSGYIFEAHDAPAMQVARELMAMLRRRGIPIVLDLVPHDFLSAVGSLAWLEAEIGPIDFVVGALSTLQGLGFGSGLTPGEDIESALLGCARTAALGRAGAIAQHRVGRDLYSQAVVGQALGEVVMERPVPVAGPRGLGDALAVEALKALRVIS